MIQLQHNNMAQKFTQMTGDASSALRSGACGELEGLAKERQAAFTDYLSARHRLALCSEADACGNAAALEEFNAARMKLRISQRNWEEHVAAHHIG